MLLSLTELALAPIRVWLAIGEVPSGYAERRRMVVARSPARLSPARTACPLEALADSTDLFAEAEPRLPISARPTCEQTGEVKPNNHFIGRMPQPSVQRS